MAYDAATGTAVLFGGVGRRYWLSDTWTSRLRLASSLLHRAHL